jgi:uncharacterized membrane protein YhaH (DUF805 family)
MDAITAPKLSFLAAVKSGLVNAFDFEGRASRREFWLFVLFQLLASVAMLTLDFAIWRNIHMTPFNWGFAALMLIPQLAMTVRRLHDIDRRGWWYLLNLVPFGALFLLYRYCRKGDAVANRFGQAPGVVIPEPAPRLRTVAKHRVAAQSTWVA